MELTETLVELSRAGGTRPESLREAAASVAMFAAATLRQGTRRDLGGIVYAIEEVTWPVSRFEDGSQAFHSPRPKPALIRGDALLVDVRETTGTVGQRTTRSAPIEAFGLSQGGSK